MFFGDMFKRQKPRGLTWIPRYYDPEDDEQYEEMRRQTRIAFNSLRTTSSRKRGMNPFVLLALVVMVGAIIMVALREPPVPDVPEVEMRAADAPTSQHPQTESLLIERDTVFVNDGSHEGNE